MLMNINEGLVDRKKVERAMDSGQCSSSATKYLCDLVLNG